MKKSPTTGIKFNKRSFKKLDEKNKSKREKSRG